MLGAIDAALDLVPGMDDERRRLADHGERLRQRLAEGGISTGASSTQIVPVIVGDAGEAVALAERLAGRGILATAIRPPTVPDGTSRLRIALRATHSVEDIDRLADILIEEIR
jgi:8-amino-7-oxononanoate synthase